MQINIIKSIVPTMFLFSTYDGRFHKLFFHLYRSHIIRNENKCGYDVDYSYDSRIFFYFTTTYCNITILQHKQQLNTNPAWKNPYTALNSEIEKTFKWRRQTMK